MRRFHLAMSLILAMVASRPAAAQVSVYVSSFYDNTVSLVSTATGSPVSPQLQTSGTGLAGAATVASRADGTVFVSSQFTGQVLRFNSSTGASLGAFPVSGGPALQAPAGIAFAPNGDVFISDFISQTDATTTGRVNRYNSAGNFLNTVVSSLNQPSGLLFDKTGRLFVTETNTGLFSGGRLLQVSNPLTASPTVTTIGGGAGLAGMTLGRVGTDDVLFIADLLGGSIQRYNLTTNAPMSDFVAAGGSLANAFPSGLLMESNGSMLVATLGSSQFPNPGNGQLLRYDSSGAVSGSPLMTGIFGSSIAPVPEPTSLALTGLAVTAAAIYRRRRAK